MTFHRGASGERELDIADVQHSLGHRHISSTLIYFRITNKRREAQYRSTLRSPEIARTAGG